MERVTVAVDGGQASDAALAWVVDRARTTEISLEITTVLNTSWIRKLGTEAEYRKHHEDLLERAKQTVFGALPDLTVKAIVRRGVPHEALIDATRSIDLLVVGTNKTPPLVGVMHGTLPLKVAGQAECTTVVVPVGWHPTTGIVVVGWTDDTTADRALELAAKEAAHHGVGLKIVHTWGVPPATSADQPTVVMEKFIAARRALLTKTADRIRLSHPTVPITTEFKGGSAAVALVLAGTDASLVVVGSRGRGSVAGFFLGSVSHDVLLNMPAPVAVVPKDENVVNV